MKLSCISAVLAVSLVASLAVPSASFAAPAPRLIETAGKRAWMNEEQIHAISHKAHSEGRCGGYIDVTDYQSDLRSTPKQGLFFFEPQTPRKDPRIETLLSELSADRIYRTVEHLSSYQTRYYKSAKGVEAAHWIADQFKAIAKDRADVSVRLFEHKGWAQPSVIARIEGSKNPEEIVVIGGHEDSVHMMIFFPNPNGDAPGADDNASGIATLMETYRVLIESGYKPERTIEFMTYAGEELGLLGSMEIASSYRKANKNVVGVLQLDMTMYPGKARQVTLITDYTDANLNQLVSNLVTEYVGAAPATDKCKYECSDHASWTKYGYASAFPFETPFGEANDDIHTPSDTLQKLDASFGLNFAKTALAFAIELGK